MIDKNSTVIYNNETMKAAQPIVQHDTDKTDYREQLNSYVSVCFLSRFGPAEQTLLALM